MRKPEALRKDEPLTAETPTDRASETLHKIAARTAGHKHRRAREREGRGGCRKARGGRWP